LKKKDNRTPPPEVLQSTDSSPPAFEEDRDMKFFDREQADREQDQTGNTTVPVEDVVAAREVEEREDNANMETKSSGLTATDRATGASRKEGLSVIGKTLFVKGKVEAAEDMLVEGRVEGSIKHTADRLIVGVSGVVNADIDAKNLVIEGTVEGNIVGSESVIIESSADVKGNIYTSRISIADGAQFSGSVDMDLSRTPKH